MAMTSRSPRRAASSMIATTSASPSEATVWMCRSARPVRSVSAIPLLQVRPDREEHRPPLLRGIFDDALVGTSESGGRRRGTFAPRSLVGHIDALEATGVAPGSRTPHAHDVRRSARLDGQQRRAERQARRRTEQLRQRPATGQVSIADETHVAALVQGFRELPARLAHTDDADTDRTP